MATVILALVTLLSPCDNPAVPSKVAPPPKITSVAEIRALAPTTRRVQLRIKQQKSPLLAELSERLPNLEELWIHHPGNKQSETTFAPISNFTQLRSLRIRGDLAMTDPMFEHLAKLRRLQSLDWNLP